MLSRQAFLGDPMNTRRGQATTEWMLLVAVLVVAVVAVGWGLGATFQDDMESLGERAGTVYTTGDLAR